MPRIYANLQEMERLSTRMIGENNGALMDTIDNLKAVREELRSMWEGNSADEFFAIYDNAISELEKQSNTLTDLHKKMVKLISAFEEANR